MDWIRELTAAHAVVERTPDGRPEPDAPAWTFDPTDPTASFWRRRQVHETAMHLWDARASQGVAGSFAPEPDVVVEAASVVGDRQLAADLLGSALTP